MWIHLAAISLIPASFLFAMGLRQMLGHEFDWRHLADKNGFEIVIICLVFVVYQVFHNNLLGEEVGWRGFALRHMQTSRSPLQASLIIGWWWWLWHLPIWSVQFSGLTNITLTFLFLLVLPLSIIHTWLFNRSGGSLWAVGLLHASSNMSWKLLPENFLLFIPVLLCLATGLLCMDKMWLRFPSDTST